jgi:hypothetical protein
MNRPPLLIERRAQQAFSVTTVNAHGDGFGRDLESLLSEAGIRHSSRHFRHEVVSGADWSSLVKDVVTVVGAAGGLGGIAAILKAVFGRHTGTTVKFGENGEVLRADGLSVDAVIRLLDRCSPRVPPDWVVRDACDTDGSEEPGTTEIFPGGQEGLRDALGAARQLSRGGRPQEVIMYVDGGHRVIRRYEDGQEVPRPPGCPPWCDRDHEDDYSQPGRPVRHRRRIGNIALTGPDYPWVNVRIGREPDGQDLATVDGHSPGDLTCSGTMPSHTSSGPLPPPSPLLHRPSAR